MTPFPKTWNQHIWSLCSLPIIMKKTAGEVAMIWYNSPIYLKTT